jgi:NDP-sugar pyrophosphorylase family protein
LGQSALKAMLLAAGEGRRLGSMTLDRPKPMLEIAGRPILEHNIRFLSRHGIRELIVNLHHCPEAVTQYFGDGASSGIRISYSYEPTLLGTAGAVKNVSDHFADTFIVMYGDNLTTCDLSRLIDFHKRKSGIATVALFYREDATSSGIAEIGPNDRIVRFLEKPRADQVFSRWVNAGIFIMEPAVLDFIPKDCPSDFGRDVLPNLLAAGQPLYGYRMTEELWWVDSQEDLERTRRSFEASKSTLRDPNLTFDDTRK